MQIGLLYEKVIGVVRSVILVRVALLPLQMLSGVVVVSCLKMWRVLLHAYIESGSAAVVVLAQPASGRSRLPSSAWCSLVACSRCCSR